MAVARLRMQFRATGSDYRIINIIKPSDTICARNTNDHNPPATDNSLENPGAAISFPVLVILRANLIINCFNQIQIFVESGGTEMSCSEQDRECSYRLTRHEGFRVAPFSRNSTLMPTEYPY